MMIILADHDVEKHARLLFSVLGAQGWEDLLDLHLAFFGEVDLKQASTDREVWRRAQERGMLLLTDNRSMRGPDALERTIREENTPTSLPVLTVGDADRLRLDQEYPEVCAERVVEIVLDLPHYLGAGRIFIP